MILLPQFSRNKSNIADVFNKASSIFFWLQNTKGIVDVQFSDSWRKCNRLYADQGLDKVSYLVGRQGVRNSFQRSIIQLI